MHLYLTGDYRNCSYANADGQVVYLAETPDSDHFKTISTVKRTSKEDGSNSPNNSFTVVGQIAFNASASSSLIQFGGASTYSRSLIRLGGQEYETNKFFGKIGRKNDLGFTGPDSVDYKWRMENAALQLVQRNGDKAEIAVFHPQKPGLLDKPEHDDHAASLEILSAGTHMTDLIVVTYVFAQKEYESRAQAQTSSRATSSGYLDNMIAAAMGGAFLNVSRR